MRTPPLMSPGAALLPLRLFLGITFVYAGVHKLTDAGFLVAGSDTYIGDQLGAFAEGTPGGPLLEAFASRRWLGSASRSPRSRSGCSRSPGGSHARARRAGSGSASCCS